MVRRLIERYEHVSPMKRARTVRPDMDTRVSSYDINLLGRLIADCRYFLGYGNGYEGHLWAGSVEDQIEKMREIYNKLGSRQDMITLDEIDDYEQRMLDVKYGNDDVYEGCEHKKESRQRTRKRSIKESPARSMNIDMWYGDPIRRGYYGADAYFNDLSATYSGNIYDPETGEIVGDYTCDDSTEIEKCLRLSGINYKF